MKNIFKKSIDSAEDPWLALLHQRATPRGKISSPASNLMGRNLRTTIPCSKHHLEPRVTVNKDRNLMKHQLKTKNYYDRTARIRPPFKEGERVMFKKTPKFYMDPRPDFATKHDPSLVCGGK